MTPTTRKLVVVITFLIFTFCILLPIVSYVSERRGYKKGYNTGFGAGEYSMMMLFLREKIFNDNKEVK